MVMTNKSTTPSSNNNNNNNNNNNDIQLREESKIVTGEQDEQLESGQQQVDASAAHHKQQIKQSVAGHDHGAPETGHDPAESAGDVGPEVCAKAAEKRSPDEAHLSGECPAGKRAVIEPYEDTVLIPTSGAHDDDDETDTYRRQVKREVGLGPSASDASQRTVNEDAQEDGNQSIDQSAGEFALLTPVTPSLGGGPGGGMSGQGALLGGQRMPQAATTSTTAPTPTTILTDLDADSQQQQQQQPQSRGLIGDDGGDLTSPLGQADCGTTNKQDGSTTLAADTSAQATATDRTSEAIIKIEHQQQQQAQHLQLQPAGPLTELTPAAVGTTFSELTSVNPITIHELHQANPHHLGQEQQQQQQLQAQHHFGLGEPAHLVGLHSHAQQQQHGLMSHVAPGDQVGAFSSDSHSPFLVSGQPPQPPPPQQQQHLTTLGNNTTSGSNNNNSNNLTGDHLASSGSNQEALQPALQRFSQTTGPPSVSSVATEASGSVGVGGGGSAAASADGNASAKGSGGGGKRRAWSQANRQANKTEIAKVFSTQGFRCYLEAPISTCRRREEDRITYINKGEFYGLTLDYIPDPQKPLRSAIVKAVIMLVFREDKSPDDDIKSWQFWHSRQHSAKQRILDVDNKNHINVINQIEEVSLNAVAFYWNPIETRQAKLNIAIQCLSTDFSNQKGVKGLPLNLQVDIYDLFTETSTPVYRAYATLLSYCDKGAQRRSRDEERRALKRKLTEQSAGGAQVALTNSKKFEDLYHKPCDRTEFYSMADLIKSPTLYSPSEQEALGLAASDSSSNATNKQPMSQASGVSVTPISATTPIPAGTATGTVGPVQQIVGGNIGADPSAVGAPLGPIATSIATTLAPTSAQTGYVTGGGAQVRSATAAGGASGGFGLTQPAVIGHAPGPYGTAIITADYMSPHVVATVGTAMLPAGQPAITSAAGGMVAMTSLQQQQQQQQQHSHLVPSVVATSSGQQAMGHGQMIGQSAMQQQHLHHQQPHHQQQQQQQQQQQHQQQQQQQQQQHYHTMTSSGTLQTPYGIIQTSTPNEQQYAILQPPSMSMVQQTGTATASHLTHMHQQHQHQQHQHQQHQHQHQQQQMLAQQHQMDPSRSHHQVVMSGGMMQHQQHQQMGQQQHQQHQHQYGVQAAPAPASNLTSLQTATMSGQTGQQQQQQQAFNKRSKLYPDERVLIYAKQADEKDFYPLHLAPPSLSGLVYAIEQKYKIDSTKVANIYKKSKKGIRVQMDDEMIRHYCNEDMVQLEVIQTADSRLEITLVEL